MAIESTSGTKRQQIGEILRFLGILSESELRAALLHQANDGGRIGTCLLDSGRVDEETLLAALGAQQRVETATAAELFAISDATASLLPTRAAILAGAVPLARREGTLEVAMMEPSSLPLVDDLARVTRLRIVPKLALELRIAEAHERLYEASVCERLARTRRRLARRLASREMPYERAS